MMLNAPLAYRSQQWQPIHPKFLLVFLSSEPAAHGMDAGKYRYYREKACGQKRTDTL